MSSTLISILAGLGGMFGWGVSDFFANQAADTVGHRKAFFWSQIAGLALMGIVAIASGANFGLSMSILPYLIVTSIGYTLGYLYFYRAFEIGNVSVVSAGINIQQVFIIGIAYFIFGQALTGMQLFGVILVITGILLVSVDFKDLKGKGISLVAGIKETLIAAAAFGVLFWPFNEFVVERADWLSASFYIKLLSILIVLGFAYYNKQNLKLTSKKGNIMKVIIAIGLLEALAVISVSYGQAFGDTIIVAPIASALSVVTISLAMIFLKEKITKYQGVGIVTTIVGILVMSM